MKTNKIAAEDFGNHLFENLHPKLKEWSSEEIIKTSILEEINEQLDWIDNQEFSERFCSYFKGLGISANKFNNRLIDFDGNKQIIAGIRFKNTNINKPFIEVTLNFEVTENDLKSIANKLKNEFSEFAPIAYEIWLPFNNNVILFEHQAIKIDQFCFAAKVSEIKMMPLPENFEKIELRNANNLDFYPEYLKLYEQYNQENPEIGSEIRLEEKNDYLDSLEQNLLFEIFIENNWAGIMTAEKGSFRGIKGILIREEIISANYRRKNLGVAIQRHLAEKLDENDILFGTIHGKNIPSQKISERNGRIKLGADYMISIYYPEISQVFLNL